MKIDLKTISYIDKDERGLVVTTDVELFSSEAQDYTVLSLGDNGTPLRDLLDNTWEYHTYNGEFPTVRDWQQFRQYAKFLRMMADYVEIRADDTPITSSQQEYVDAGC